jgi:hypothetical protein
LQRVNRPGLARSLREIAELASLDIAIAAAAEEAASLRLQLMQAVEDESKAKSLVESAKRMLSDSDQEVSEMAETKAVTNLSKILVDQLVQFQSLLAAERAAYAQLEADLKVLKDKRLHVASEFVAANARCSEVQAKIDSATRAAAAANQQCTALAVQLAAAVQDESARATELRGLKLACRSAECAILTVSAETDATRCLLWDLTQAEQEAVAARQLSQLEHDLAAGAVARARTAATEVAALVAAALAARVQAEAELADARHRLAVLKEECAAAGKDMAAVIPWYIVIYHGISWCTMVYRDIPRYSIIYHGISRYTVVYRGIPRYIVICRGISWYTVVYHDIPWYTTIYHGVPSYTTVYRGIPWYFHDSRNVRSRVREYRPGGGGEGGRTSLASPGPHTHAVRRRGRGA